MGKMGGWMVGWRVRVCVCMFGAPGNRNAIANPVTPAKFVIIPMEAKQHEGEGVEMKCKW